MRKESTSCGQRERDRQEEAVDTTGLAVGGSGVAEERGAHLQVVGERNPAVRQLNSQIYSCDKVYTWGSVLASNFCSLFAKGAARAYLEAAFEDARPFSRLSGALCVLLQVEC